MADRPSITTFNSGGRYDTATLNSNFQAIRDAFDVLVGLNGTSGDNNTLTGNMDAGNNRIINIAQLEAETILLNSVNVSALFGNLTPRGDWVTATDYAVRDIVFETDTVYICIVAHTSGTFSTDLAADKWMVFSSGLTSPVAVADGGTGSTNASDARTAFAVPGTSTVNTFTKTQIWSKGADVASASALTLGTDGNYFDITGTTAVTSINTVAVGTAVKLHFDGVLTLTHHATDLILPSGANITTAAGDEAEFIEYATGDWRCTNYSKADGTAVVESSTPASSIPTGSVQSYLGSTEPSGWIFLDGLTIGNAASGADRANADTEDLFTLLWNSLSDSEAAVSSGRGGNAAADYAANKTLTLPDARGRALFGNDNMGGNNAGRLTTGGSGLDGDTLGKTGGSETHTLTTAELSSHSHTGTNMGGTISNGADGAGSTTYGRNNTSPNTGNAGSGDAHNNVPPGLVVNMLIKL